MLKNRTLNVCLIAFLAMWTVGVASAATVHTTFASFNAVLDGVNRYFNNFSTVGPGASPPLPFSGGPGNIYSYVVGTPPGSISGLFNDTGVISTDNAQDKIRITMTGAPVHAVGGDMYGTDINFLPVTTNVTITLSDGTVETYLSSSTNRFRGFDTCGGPAITFVDIDAADTPAFAWPTLDNLYVGACVPEPGHWAAAMSALGMLLAFRRRR